ncbi:MAG: ArsR/SmtB family transcription factor [Myxococcota bacterium]
MPRAAASPILSEEAIDLVARRFRALADPNRLRILNALMQGEHSVGDLAALAGLEQPSVSRHLAVLRQAGIVSRRAQGNRGFYRIEDPTVIRLCEVVCGGLVERLAEDLEALPDARAWRGAQL